MKKLVALLIIVAVAMPAMAATTVTCAQVGSTAAFTVSYAYTTGTSFPRAFALDISTNLGSFSAVTPTISGESLSTAKGFGIFPGTIAIDTAGNVTSVGTPVAPQSDLPSGTQPGLGASSMTIELGSLYAVTAAKPDNSGVIVTVTMSGLAPGTAIKTATITIAANTARGGLVLEDATTAAVSSTCVVTIAALPPAACFASAYTAVQSRWVASGSPACWCPPISVTGLPVGGSGYQCLGDADGLKAPITNIRVGSGDLTKLSQSWNKVLGAVGYNACADIDHAAAPITNIGVGSSDLTRVSQNWNSLDAACNLKLGQRVGPPVSQIYCGQIDVPVAYK
jgi:hypothetical protein